MPNIVLLETTKKQVRYPVFVSEKAGVNLQDYAVLVKLARNNFFSWDVLTEDGSNLYVIDEHGNPLYYWFEYISKANQEARLWVKINSLLANEIKKLYLIISSANPYYQYYDPTEVFLYFDHFNIDTSSKYEAHRVYGDGRHTFTVGNSQAIIGDPGDTGDENYFWKIPIDPSDGLAVGGKLDKVEPLFVSDLNSVPHWQIFYIGFAQDLTKNDMFYVIGYKHPDSTGSPYHTIVKSVNGTRYSLIKDTRYIYGYTTELGKYGAKFVGKINGDVELEDTESAFENVNMYVVFRTGTCWNKSEAKSYWDWIYVRKFVYPEPSVEVLEPIAVFKGTYDLY